MATGCQIIASGDFDDSLYGQLAARQYAEPSGQASGLWTGGLGRGVVSSPRAMSALGQKQTFAVQNGMSASPPIADIRRLGRDVR